MFISKKLLFFQSPSRRVKNVRGSNLFQGDGAHLFFFYRTCCLSGGSGHPVPPPPPPPGFAHCIYARVHVCSVLKSPKRSM